jgi:hypothetical protein
MIQIYVYMHIIEYMYIIRRLIVFLNKKEFKNLFQTLM